MTQHYTVYETTNLVNGKFYRGSHITDDIHDDYLGSGNRLVHAVKKYGKENFKKRTFAWCANEENMKEIERLLVTQSEIDNPDCYNLVEGGGRPPLHTGYSRSEETKAKMRANNSMKRPEVVAKVRAANVGRIVSEESKAKMRAAKMGRTLSEEHKAHIKAARTDKHSVPPLMTGTIWINNGIINKRVPRDAQIPENFTLGRK